MRTILTVTLLALAGAIAADDAKKQETTGTTAPVTTTLSETSGPAGTEDSPLVRAARRANRLGKKPATLITNESVKKSRGHITTTTQQRSVDVPVPKMAQSEKAALDARAAAKEQARVRVIGEEKAKKEAEEALARKARAAQAAEEGYYENEDYDPARSEHEADAATNDNPPASSGEQKPPAH